MHTCSSGLHEARHCTMADKLQDSFYFAGRVPRLLVDGLTITNTTDLAFVLIGIVVTAFLAESLQRISRECLRKVPLPSKAEPGTASPPTEQQEGSEDVPLTRYTKLNEDERELKENSSFLRPGEENGNIPVDNEVGCVAPETSCCSRECDLKIVAEKEEETASLVDVPVCCRDVLELTEEQKAARLERMWKSLSLEVLADRWVMLQTTCDEKKGSPRKITRCYRVVFHFLQTVLNTSQLTIGYILMLVVMTYNAWFLLCVVGGAGLGYLLFSWDLERMYANYAECYVKRKVMEEDARRKAEVCSSNGSCEEVSKREKRRGKIRETYC